MTTHVEHLRTALDAYDEARRTPGSAVVSQADELATRVRNLLEQIEGIKREKP